MDRDMVLHPAESVIPTLLVPSWTAAKPVTLMSGTTVPHDWAHAATT